MLFSQQDLKGIIARTIKTSAETINEQSGLAKTYNWDSLNHVSILTEVEAFFDIVIQDEWFPKLLTYQAISEYLNGLDSVPCFVEVACPCSSICFSEKKITFYSNDGTSLNGVFTYSKESPKGLVLLTHGIPADKNEGGFYKDLAGFLAKNGYDSFRFDFRYMGENYERIDGELFNLSSREELAINLSMKRLIEDIESAFETALEQRQQIHYNNLFGIATSCSAGLLLKWINDYNHVESFDGAILCCPVLDYVYECTGVPKENVDKNIIVEQLEKNGYIPERDAMYGKTFFEEALMFDANCEIARFGKRIVILHGDRDQCVPIEFSNATVEKNKNVELIVVPNAKHGFSALSQDSSGRLLSKEEKLIKKKQNRGKVINSITFMLRGWENGK